MTILGYSERGVINSLIYNIGYDKNQLTDFIKLINIPTAINIGVPNDYEIIMEQSFSQFGSSDLIIIINPNKEDKIALFFEAKVMTCQGIWDLEKMYDKFKRNIKYRNYASNLFFQLYLKELLINNFNSITKQIAVIDKLGNHRQIGKNKVVNKTFNKISERNAYYIGIVPTSDNEIKTFMAKNPACTNYFLSWEAIYKYCVVNNLQKY